MRATSTPLDLPLQTLFVQRPSVESNVAAVKVPSVSVRNGDVAVPAMPTPIESPMYAIDELVLPRVTTLTVKPGDGRPNAPRKSQAFIRVTPPFDPVSTMSLNQIPSY